MRKEKKIRTVRRERNRRFRKKLSKFQEKNITVLFHFLSHAVHNRSAVQEIYLFVIIWIGKVPAYLSERPAAGTSWLTAGFKVLPVCVCTVHNVLPYSLVHS